MKRHHNWVAMLPAHTMPNRGRTFEWGRWDCALAVCDAIRAFTGVDPGAPYRGTYSTEAEARAITGGDLGKFAATIAALHGMPEVEPRMARRGDVVFVDNNTPEGALGIVDSSGVAAACVGEQGSIRVPLRRWKRAWHVGSLTHV
jgi:hypothetical protein